MAAEVLVPPLEDYEQRAASFQIEPEELARLGLSMIGHAPRKYVKSHTTAEEVQDYGYVMPYKRNGQDYFLRSLYLREDKPDIIHIPRQPEELGAHLRWHQDELARLRRHGLSAAAHMPVIVKDDTNYPNELGCLDAIQTATLQGREGAPRQHTHEMASPPQHTGGYVNFLRTA